MVSSQKLIEMKKINIYRYCLIIIIAVVAFACKKNRQPLY